MDNMKSAVKILKKRKKVKYFSSALADKDLKVKRILLKKIFILSEEYANQVIMRQELCDYYYRLKSYVERQQNSISKVNANIMMRICQKIDKMYSLKLDTIIIDDKINKYVSFMKKNIYINNLYNKNREIIEFNAINSMPSFNERTMFMMEQFEEQIDCIIFKKKYYAKETDPIDDYYKDQMEIEFEKIINI